MNFIVIGTNHNYSPLPIREKLAFTRRGAERALAALRPDGPGGLLILSTCNRVEIYGQVKDGTVGFKILEKILLSDRGLDPVAFRPYLYGYEGKEAVRHLFAVASGLDSQVLGERQIWDQVREASRRSRAAALLPEEMGGIFRRALEAGVRVRRETGISEGNVSIGSVARRLIEAKLGDPAGRRVVIVGTGKIAGLVGKYLAKAGARIVLISNRNHRKAARLARSLGGKVARFSELGRLLSRTDVLISATASPHPVLGKEDLESVGRPLLIVDLAVPRDVDPGVSELAGVSLFDLDDLDGAIRENLGRRQREAGTAREIVEMEAEELWRELLELELEPALWR